MENILTEELKRQLSLINYDRGKTLLEQLSDAKSIVQLMNENLYEETESKTSSDYQNAIEYVKSLGSPSEITYNKNMSFNQVLSWYAINSIKLLTNHMINKNNIGNDYCFSLKIKSLSNAPKKFSLDSFSTDEDFKLGLLKYINSSDIQEKKQRTIGNTIFLEDFYYNWSDIVKDWKDSYSKSPNETTSTLFPDGWFNFMNYWFGTTNFILAKSKIDKLTTAASCEGDRLVSLKSNDFINSPDELVYVLHRTLEGLSILASLFPGIPGYVASAAFDLIDASLYMWYDKDPFMAGLMVCFALIPGDVIFRALPELTKFTKGSLKTFFDKILNKGSVKFLESEKKLLKQIGSRLFLREVYILIIKQTVNKFLGKIYLRGFIKLILFLVKKGYLLGSFLVKLGIYVGGIYLTWSEIAKMLGIGVNDAINQSTKIMLDDLKPIIIDNFNTSIGEKNVYSEKSFKNYFSENVLYMQLFLYHGNYDTYTENIDTNKLTNDQLNSLYNTSKKIQNKFKFNSVEYKNGTPYIRFNDTLKPELSELKKGDKIKITNSKLNGTWVVSKTEKNVDNEIMMFSVKQTYSTTRGFMDDEFTKKLNATCGLKETCSVTGDIEVIKSDNNSNVITYDELLKKQAKIEDLKFKWGYYDNQTTKAIKNFQFKEGLSVDGSAGKNTLEKMVKLLKGNFPKIKNVTNVDISKEIEKTMNKLISDSESEKKDITIQEVEIVYEEQKESEVIDQLQKEIDSMMRSIPEYPESKIVEDSSRIQQFQNQ
jgi:hypothetical protein